LLTEDRDECLPLTCGDVARAQQSEERRFCAAMAASLAEGAVGGVRLWAEASGEMSSKIKEKTGPAGARFVTSPNRRTSASLS
jgi:hypothetical protein